MIAYLEGQVQLKAEKFVVINAGGVGYKVFIGPETLRRIPEKSENVKIWTHQYVRENSLELYGFLHYAELELFEALIDISGIGPKGALGIMAIAPVDTLKKAIASGDTSYLTRVSGVGRKTAEKIVLELKEKLAGKGITVTAPELAEEADALEALMALGYSQREAREALSRVGDKTSNAEQQVKEALQNLSNKK